MDSNGVLYQTTPPGVPVYDAPFALPVDPEKLKKALEGVKKFMADTEDPKNKEKFVDKLGVPLELFDVLSGIGKVAGVIAPYIAAIAIAYDCLRIMGFIKKDSGPSALETLVENRFNQQEQLIILLQTLEQQKDVRDGKIAVGEFLNDVNTYVTQLKSANPNLTQLEFDRNSMLGNEKTKRGQIEKLLDSTTWLAIFNHFEHTKVWPYMQNVLHVMPANVANPVPAPMPPVPSARFDHRLMVPLASFAALAYLTCIRGISPEYRTTGDFQGTLRSFALKLDSLAENMLRDSLARTIYKSSDFAMVAFRPWEVVGGDFPFFPDEEITISRTCNRFPVGAMDLRYHNDAFFGPFLDELSKSELFGNLHATKYGSMEFRWIPPAKLKKVDRGTQEDPIVYMITNPDECAAAANELSQQDYADLLLSGGYSNLLHLGALYRNESTEPAKSQTVAGEAYLSRSTRPSVEITIQSEPILGTGIIQSLAKRQPQECSAFVDIWTQSVKRARPLEYTIKLRTLNCLTPTSGGTLRWKEVTYESFQWTQYDRDLSDSRFLKMDVINTIGSQADEHLLMAGSSPREPRHTEGVAEMKAHTFDWWIPIKPPFSLGIDPQKTFAQLRSAGWSGPVKSETIQEGNGKSTLGVNGNKLPLAYDISVNSGPIFDPHPSPTFFNGVQNWEGEHREGAETMVKIEYRLDWDADRLFISLKNRPADRNYVVFVVIEEKMPFSGQILHTAIPVPVNGQLTYVPQKFFDEESAARERLKKAMDDFNDKYSKSVVVGPDDPVLGWVRPGDTISIEGLERIVHLARQHQPDLFKQVMTAHGIKENTRKKSGYQIA